MISISKCLKNNYYKAIFSVLETCLSNTFNVLTFKVKWVIYSSLNTVYVVNIDCKQYLLVEGVVVGGWVQGPGNQDSYDQPVDGNDTRHDNGNDGLHDELRPHHWHGGNTGTWLGGSIGSSQRWNIHSSFMSVLNESYESLKL